MGVVLTLLFLLGLANHFVVNLLILRLTSIDPAQRGTIMGLNSAVTYLGVFAGTSSFGPIYAHHGFAAAACAAMVLTLVAAGVSFWR
jgi:MFS transporter, DHA1 family, inner membrane transport protein